MIEQRLAVARVTRPAQSFHSPAGSAALSPVVENDRVFGGKRRDCIYSRPGRRRAPLINGRVETAGRAHKYRRPCTVSFIIGIDSVNRHTRHRFPPTLLLDFKTRGT